MSDRAVHRTIEVASLRAWPAIEESDLRGWILRCSQGFTGRANSVQSLQDAAESSAGAVSEISLEERVTACERWYEERGQTSLFRMTPFSEPGLDEYLEKRGYEPFNRTVVLFRAASGVPPEMPYVELVEVELHEWLGRYAGFTGMPATPAPMRHIIEKSAGRALTGLLRAGQPERAVACGLAVLDEGFLGLFDLVVEPSERRKGYGDELVRRLVAWGSGHGARLVYLQVTLDNEPALALYDKLGFERAYEYWYRVPRS
ncbi:MAG: GNAT family N-acetyltransferase [Gemmatimonadota bacterium]|jgi:GNAT superfamily N-acetyltransferase